MAAPCVHGGAAYCWRLHEVHLIARSAPQRRMVIGGQADFLRGWSAGCKAVAEFARMQSSEALMAYLTGATEAATKWTLDGLPEMAAFSLGQAAAARSALGL